MTTTTTPTSAPTQVATTTTTSGPTAPATVVPMTEVFVNGSSVGSVATSQLAGGFARLFALTGGSASSLRAWAPPGSVVDLGAVQPSGSEVRARAIPTPSAGKHAHPAHRTTHPGHRTPFSGHPKLGAAAIARAAGKFAG